jgi:two-component system chemotaxis sensor kinase CheA
MTSVSLDEYFLIVEDDTDLREAIAECVTGLGCQIQAFSNAEDALEFAHLNKCFAVVSDYRMPGINGIEFCKRLKQESPKVKFVILTGYADKQTVLEGLRVGIDDLLEKPQDLARLREQAESYVRSRFAELKNEKEELLLLRRVFCDEANELMRDFEGIIFRLEEVPFQNECVDVLLRKVHTLKGSAAALAGAEKITSVAHAYENLLHSIQSGRRKPSQSLTHVLLQGADVIKSLVSDFENHRDRRINVQPFIEALNRWTEGRVDGLGETPAVATETSSHSEQSVRDDGIVWLSEIKTLDSHVSESNSEPSEEQQPDKSTEPLVEQVPVAVQQAWRPDRPAVDLEDEDKLLVSIDKLNSFMELSGELVVLKNGYHATIKQVLKCTIPPEQKQRLEEMNHSLDKISEEIQGQIMEIRKVQLREAFQKFPRVVRQSAQELHKQVRIEMTGMELGVDRSIAKALSSALVHAVRNAVDHGIEAPEIRLRKNKPEVGLINIFANQVGDRIHITIEDDGAGIDPELVRRKALERALLSKETAFAMQASEIIDLVFHPGFSTAERVTQVSGRGIGMDVIRTEVHKLGGTCALQSKTDSGTQLKIIIPVPKTVLVENTLLAESGGHQIVVPLASISKITPIGELLLSRVEGRMTCQHEGVTIPVGDFLTFVDSPQRRNGKVMNDFGNDSLVLIVTHKEHSVALVVDKVVDQLEAVIRPFDNVIEKLTGFKGTSLLDSENVAFVLDAESLLGAAYAA